jgi:hypothetical protein
MSRRELTRYNKELPPEFQIPPRTLQHWLDSGRLAACMEIAGDPLYANTSKETLAQHIAKEDVCCGMNTHRSRQNGILTTAQTRGVICQRKGQKANEGYEQ